MNDGLHVDAVVLHYDVPERSAVPHLDRRVRRGLARCGRHVQPPTGLPPDAVIAVQTLALGLDLEGEPSDTQLAEAFGRAFTEGLATLVADVAPGIPADGGDETRLVWFEHEHAAERAWIAARDDERATRRWYWAHLVDRAWLEAPDACVLSWAERAPGWHRTSLWELLRSAREPARVLPPGVVRALLRTLRPGAPQPEGRRAAPTARDSGGPHERPAAAGEAPSASDVAWLAEARAAWHRASAEDRAVFERLGGPWRELAGWLLAARVFPALDTWSTEQAAALLRVATETARRPASTSASASAAAPARSEGQPSLALESGSDPASSSHTDDAPRLPDTPTVASHRVRAGGMLFLVNRIDFAAPWLPTDAAALHGELEALGLSLLQRLLDPLPGAARLAALQAEAPVLAAFCGGPPDPELGRRPWSPIDDTGLAAWLDDLPELPDRPEHRLLLALPEGPTPLDRALQRLLARPGRLDLTATHADLYLPLASVELPLRLAGWDLDPGWVPALGRVIRFHYEARP